MSRVVTPSVAKPAGTPVQVPHEKIAKRAYEKWLQRGQPPGTDMQDWLEAEKELKAEMTRHAPPTAQPAPATHSTRTRR